MSVVAAVVFGGSRDNLVPSQVAIRRVVAWVGDTSVEALLPEGGRSLQLPCSGGSSVLGVHADGGTPDGDFTKEGRGWMTARQEGRGWMTARQCRCRSPTRQRWL